jgi:hypothetical protein
VRVYLTSKLWLGAWLGAKRKDKKQRVRSKDNKLRLGYTLYSKGKNCSEKVIYYLAYGTGGN